MGTQLFDHFPAIYFFAKNWESQLMRTGQPILE
jgi:hypothetical protein